MPVIRAKNVGGLLEVNEKLRFTQNVILPNTPFVGKYLYVDYDGGNVIGGGDSPAQPTKYPESAIARLAPHDVIYIKPRSPELGSGGAGPYYGGDPQHVKPGSAANWIIPYTKYGVKIIGAGNGFGQAVDLAGYSGVLTPVLWVKAPYVTLEGLTFRAGSSTDAALKFSFHDSLADQSWASTVYGCTFWKIPSTVVNGALFMDSCYYQKVIGCRFLSCYRGIVISSGNSVPKGIYIDDIDFQGLITEISADIYSGAVINIHISRTRHNHLLPTGGAPNVFLSFSVASTGEWMDSYTGATATAIATNATLNGIGYSNIRCGDNKTIMASA